MRVLLYLACWTAAAAVLGVIVGRAIAAGQAPSKEELWS